MQLMSESLQCGFMLTHVVYARHAQMPESLRPQQTPHSTSIHLTLPPRPYRNLIRAYSELNMTSTSFGGVNSGVQVAVNYGHINFPPRMSRKIQH